MTMNRTSLAIQMLRILKARPVTKKQELAELLETNPRNIIELKRELETAGYNIEVTSGPNGGYRLVEEGMLATPDLTKEESEALQEVLLYLKSNRVTLRKDAESALEKVLAVSLKEGSGENIVSSGTRLAMPLSQLQSVYETILHAIEDNHRIRITYKTGNQKTSTWVIHPYGMFLYKGMWYLVGYREHDHEVTLKLNRILKLEVLNLPFSKPSDFSIRKYATNYGISVEGDNHLKCMIANRFYISEYIYGDNQKIEPIDDKTILFEADFPNELTLKSFVLDLASDCRVLEPEWLAEYLKEESEKVHSLYEKEESD